MNWLAHIFISEDNIEFQIGNYLADPLKGKLWVGASDSIAKGMFIHKTIDSYSDSHELFKKSKSRLGTSGLLRGVVIDLTYDYLLTKHWKKYCKIDINSFLNEFYIQAQKQVPHLPPKAKIPLERMIKYKTLNNYKTLDELQLAFSRLDKRLSPRLANRDTSSSYSKKVKKNINKIEDDFLEFFPSLCNEIKKHLDSTKLSHWNHFL